MNDSNSTIFVGSCFFSKVQWCNVQSAIALFYQLLMLFSNYSIPSFLDTVTD